MTDEISLRNNIQAFAAFIPFAPFALKALHTVIPLKWIALLTVLQTISLLSFYLNLIAQDLIWCFFSVWAYIAIAMPAYMNSIKNSTVNIETSRLENQKKLTFDNLYTICAKAVFSDYRVSLLSKIPLALQVLVGGSVLYHGFGADWIMHTLAGFGIGAIALKAYLTAVSYYGYSRLASYFHLGRFRTFKSEPKGASAEFTLFSVVVVALTWEAFERSVHFISPANAFRVGVEPLWNIIGDILVAMLGAMIAWHIFTHKFNLRQQRTGLSLN